MHPNQYTKSEYDVFTKARNQELIQNYSILKRDRTKSEIAKLYCISLYRLNCILAANKDTILEQYRFEMLRLENELRNIKETHKIIVGRSEFKILTELEYVYKEIMSLK